MPHFSPLTFYESRNKAVCGLVDQVAFTSNTNSSQDVVTCHHRRTDVRLKQLSQYRCRGRLELVLEDDETSEFQLRLGLVSLHFLGFDPAKFWNMASCAANDAITFMCIVGKLIIIVDWDYVSKTRVKVSGAFPGARKSVR